LKEQETAKKGGKKKEKEAPLQDTVACKIFILVLLCPWKKCLNHTWQSIPSLRY
jgi:hypothetical protein